MCIGCIVLAAAALPGISRTAHREASGRDTAAAVPAHAVDLNAAGEAELALLPGIGPSLARRIAADRVQRGPFATVDDLRRVKGIGPATLERIRPFAVAGRHA